MVVVFEVFHVWLNRPRREETLWVRVEISTPKSFDDESKRRRRRIRGIRRTSDVHSEFAKVLRFVRRDIARGVVERFDVDDGRYRGGESRARTVGVGQISSGNVGSTREKRRDRWKRQRGKCARGTVAERGTKFAAARAG